VWPSSSPASTSRCPGAYFGTARNEPGLVTAAVVLATVPVGPLANAGLQLAAIVTIVAAMLLLEHRSHTYGTGAGEKPRPQKLPVICRAICLVSPWQGIQP
jgi:uncharacterized membrane protein YhiD involved in acid resistance